MSEQIEIDFDAIDKEIAKIVHKPKPHAQHKPLTVEEDMKAFKAILNRKPTANMLKKNSYYGNMYIPIEVLERMLSALYSSYNFVMNIPPIVEEGNIIFMVDVVLRHPVNGGTVTYTGVSAVPIKPVNGTLRDVHPHIPAAKSFAIMNACKHIGRLFRAENDSITDIFDTYFEEEKKVELTEEDKAKKEMKKRLLRVIKAKKTHASILDIVEDVRKLDDEDVNKAYDEKRDILISREK